MPLPTERERRLDAPAPGRRAAGPDRGDRPTPIPRPPAPATPSPPSSARSRERRARRRRGSRPRPGPADPARARGRHGAGANLLEVAAAAEDLQLLPVHPRTSVPAPVRLPARLPDPSSRTGRRAFTFGSTAHAAFEAFTKERRERLARGEPPPTRDDLERLFQRRVAAGEFGERATEETYQRRVGDAARQLLDRRARRARRGDPGGARFELVIDPVEARRRADSPARSTGSTGCHPAASRSSTTRPAASARRTWTKASSCRSTPSPAAMRWASARRSG